VNNCTSVSQLPKILRFIPLSAFYLSIFLSFLSPPRFLRSSTLKPRTPNVFLPLNRDTMRIFEIFRFFAIAFLLLLSCLPLAFAFNAIIVPSTIAAGDNMNIPIDHDFYDLEFDSFRVYLAISFLQRMQESGPSCVLLSSSPMSTTNIGGEIPQLVGEDGEYYAIAVQPFNQDPNNRTVDNSSTGIIQYSRPFSLNSTNGTWAQFERDGRHPGYPDFISCSSYNCIRSCYQLSYPADYTEDPCGDAPRKAYECFAACPDTIFPYWPNEIVSLYGTDCSHLSFLPMSTMTVTANTTAITTLESATASHAITSGPLDTKSGVPPTKTSHASTNRKTLVEIWALLSAGVLVVVIGNLCRVSTFLWDV
jgi:hypothetical protein